jgi:integrase
MKHRGHGEGTIYHRQDGRWVASITLETGKRKTFYGKTRKEVQEKLKIALREQQQGTLVTAPEQTVKQFLDDWLENSHKQNIRPRSHERYEQIVRLHIIPYIGKVQLQKLAPQQLKKLYADKLKEGLSAITVTAIHNLLHRVLDDAVKWDLLARNVCDRVSPPRKEHREITPLTVEQIHQLLEAASGHPQEALFVLALHTGLRRGELLGLKWQDISFTEGTLQVRRILNRVPTKMVKEVGQRYIEAEPKTKKSRRNIFLTESALDALKQHQSRQMDARLKAGAAWENHDYVFCTPLGRHLTPGHDALVQLKKLLAKAGLPEIRFHDLRHSSASLLLSLGVHPKVVQELLGHTQISMTMDIYSHVLPTMQKEAMEKLNRKLQQ